jgi:hypothetical protein
VRGQDPYAPGGNPDQRHAPMQPFCCRGVASHFGHYIPLFRIFLDGQLLAMPANQKNGDFSLKPIDKIELLACYQCNMPRQEAY